MPRRRVLVVAALVCLLSGCGSPDIDALPEPSLGPDTRLVGIGNLAVAVPASWATNRTRCTVPAVDTVLVDVGALSLCGTPYPAGIESVALASRPRSDHHADSVVWVDGLRAERSRTTCTAAIDQRVCAGSLYFPEQAAYFRATSSTGPEQVDEILGWVRAVPGRVAVPGYHELDLVRHGTTQDLYLAALSRAGLAVDLRLVKQRPFPGGLVRSITPAPGTVVEPGSTVRVVATAALTGPADEIAVGVNTFRHNTSQGTLDDAAVRAGGRLEVPRGTRIIAFGNGKRASTLRGELDGDAVAPELNTAYGPRAWTAVRPGSTRITLVIRAAGKRIELGTVTIVVR